MIAGYAVPDFVSDFWNYYIIAITVVSILGIIWFLKKQSGQKLAPGEKAALMDHAWDGDLQELNNPLPKWWLYMFWFLIVFGIVYLILFPGLGKFPGVLNWSSASQYSTEKSRVDAEFDKVMEPFLHEDVMKVAADPTAKAMGNHLFLTYCSQCHGSNAEGDGKIFPNLTNRNMSLFGATPDDIRNSIANGHMAEMPANMLGDEQSAKEVANYILSLGGKPHDAALAEVGKTKFAACAGCHGEDAKGNVAAGFPDLTDNAWEYGGSEAAIVETIMKGRKGGMPAFQEMLGDAKIQLLTAYVWGMKGVDPIPAAAPAETPTADPAAPAAEVSPAK
jgi:cytochrome c oxidase cbb3-type subunit 3